MSLLVATACFVSGFCTAIGLLILLACKRNGG